MTLAEAVPEPSPATLGEALRRAARDPSAGVRLLDRRESPAWLPWSALLAGAQRIAAGLAGRGVERGDRVGLILGTGRELLEAFFGVSLAGAVPACLPPPPRLSPLRSFGRRTDAMLDAAEARLVLTEPRSVDRLAALLAPRPLGVESPADQPAVRRPASGPASPADLAMVQFTSGTALAPKPVALSHRSVLGQARLLNSFWPESGEVREVGCTWLPLHHDMGLIGCVLTALERPGELVLMPPELFAACPAAWLRAISRFGATVSPATNFAYAYCVEAIRDEQLAGVDLSGWRVALNGAEPVSADVMRRFAHRFGRWGFRAEALTPVYGLAEASLAVTFSDVGRRFVSRRFERSSLAPGRSVAEDGAGRELVSVGRPLPGFELSIRDPGGSALAEGAVGHVWARGPTLMEGYLGRPAATAEVLDGGWLDTGDLGVLHAGELFICGRAKDIIIVRGRNHSPIEIEQAAESVPGVQVGGAAAVSHFPEGADRERVLLFVERARGAPAESGNGLRAACRAAVLGLTGVDVDHLQVLPPDAIPRTSSGKVRRAEMLRRHLAGRLGAP